MIGIGCGLAALSRSAVARVLYVLVGYVLAVVLRSGTARTFGGVRRSRGLLLFMVPLFLAMIGLVTWRGGASNRARYSPGSRWPRIAPGRWRCCRRWPGATAGGAAVAASGGTREGVAEYQTAVTELAFPGPG
jgi:hypothetical protein